MLDITLTIYSVEDTKELPLSGDHLSIGRSDASDLMLNDDGLSRVHATIYCEGDRVWILDEASTNGTYVNDVPVPPTGSPLKDGDEIGLGNHTTILIKVRQSAVTNAEGIGAAEKTSGFGFSPLAAAAVGIVVVLLGVVLIGSYATSGSASKKNARVMHNDQNAVSTPVRNDSNTTAKVAPSVSPADTPTAPSPTEPLNNGPTNPPVVAKTYRAMTPVERTAYVGQEAQQVARMIGNRDGYAFTPEVVAKIKIWVDSYANRLNQRPPTGGCRMGDDLRTLLTRASLHAPLITKSFYEKGLSPQVGIYLAMIESRYCPCLSSGTGAKGMFQFVGTTARRYGVKDVSQPSTDPRPDDRCKVEIMAPIAAQYVKDLVALYGTGPLSVPLAIASYNSGEGGLSGNLSKTLNEVRGSERSFWALVADSSRLSSQFQRENINYVPQFFGAAIVGENPRVFGVDMNPLSTYSVSSAPATGSVP
jgi:hypothetical protein